MIYDIRHLTTYAYESPVSFARCALRLEPRGGDGQQLVSHSVDIKPRLEVVKTAEPPVRKAGVKVKSVAELVEKLKDVGAI